VPENRDFIRVGRSRIHGRGVFAKRKIPKGTRVIEYLGERILVEEFCRDPEGTEPARVYALYLDENTVIDGALNGNDARFVNHSCDPNCEAYCVDERVYIYAMSDIARGEELTFDYKLAVMRNRPGDIQDSNAHICRCGSANCRGTMLAATEPGK
jgi:SET domain-containing protein